jgi:pantetheine-phosphate adenylyltransferase
LRVAIYPGTFDPITNGHLDIIQRATLLFDRVIVAEAMNIEKKPLFSVSERLEMIKEVTSDISDVSVDSFEGLLVDYAEKMGACAVIRGLRAISDFDYEFQMALINRKLNDKIVTVFLMPDERHIYINSSIVKEVARFGGNVSCFVPDIVLEKLKKRLRNHDTN